MRITVTIGRVEPFSPERSRAIELSHWRLRWHDRSRDDLLCVSESAARIALSVYRPGIITIVAPGEP